MRLTEGIREDPCHSYHWIDISNQVADHCGHESLTWCLPHCSKLEHSCHMIVICDNYYVTKHFPIWNVHSSTTATWAGLELLHLNFFFGGSDLWPAPNALMKAVSHCDSCEPVLGVEGHLFPCGRSIGLHYENICPNMPEPYLGRHVFEMVWVRLRGETAHGHL